MRATLIPLAAVALVVGGLALNAHHNPLPSPAPAYKPGWMYQPGFNSVSSHFSQKELRDMANRARNKYKGLPFVKI